METYSSAIMVLGALAVLMLVQLIVADVIGIKRKRIPGSAITGDHSDSLFRASRAVANTNESIAIFICAFLYCILSGASPEYTAMGGWAFFAARLAYVICYYANIQTLRSICFGVSMLAIVALLMVGFFT